MRHPKSPKVSPQLAISNFEAQTQQLEPQPYCTCGKCIAGYISPRMKWFLMRYASIFEDLLPRSLNVFEGTGTEDRASEADFLDLDAYNDLDHMPTALRRTIAGNIRVMHGYCEVFGCITTCLKEDRAPTSSLLDRRIRYSWCSKSEDAKIFLQAGGKSMYALQYLIKTLKDLMLVRNGSRLAEGGLVRLPMCFNDTAYDLIGDRLLEI